MTDRATCWSITINNPTQEEYQIVLPARWKLEGQIERGSEGTEHYQGMLSTPQVRFSAVKKVFPRAHIEVARNKQALQKYVHKEETRVSEVVHIPTLFEYQTIIANEWVDEEYGEFWEQAVKLTSATNIPCPDETAMRYLDSLVAKDIESGRCGAEYIAINPMWRSSWKKFWRSIIKRRDARRTEDQQADRQESGTEGAPTPSGAIGV